MNNKTQRKATNAELTDMSFLLGPDSSRGSKGLFKGGIQKTLNIT